MSFQAMTWAVKQKVGDPAAKLVLLMLANRASPDDAKCWPSFNRIADETELSRPTVIRKVQYLIEKGFLTREQKQTPAGTYNVYTLCHTDTPSITVTPPLVAQCDPPGIRVIPETVIETIKSETDTLVRPKRVRTHGSEKFEEFWKAYPTDPLMAKKPAREAFERLPPEDQDRCIAAVSAFRAHCAKDATYRPLHAVRFITQRRFEGFATVSVGASDAPVFMSDEEHAQWWASRRGAA